MKRNPSWTRDELILALDLYMRHRPLRLRQDDSEIVTLSKTLNALPIHASDSASPTFRNANGVYMKLCNFLRFDPSYDGAGLSAGNKLEEEVWNTFHDRIAELHHVAAAIKANKGEVPRPREGQDDVDPDSVEASEGKLLTRLHRIRERCPSIVRKKKQQVLDQNGSLVCEACGFDFAIAYGDLGEGFAECHHTTPVSHLRPGQKTQLADLAIVCANCHRMIHRRRPWPSVGQLRSVMAAQQNATPA